MTIPFKEPRVFIPQEEKRQYERTGRKTEELKSDINNMLASIADENLRDGYRDAWHIEVLKRKGSTKKDFISSYEELSLFLQESNDSVDLLPDLDGDS